MKNNNGILTPSDGKWLYNEKTQDIFSKVTLGIEADEFDWIEITTEEKVRLEAMWGLLNNPTDSDEATTEDLYNALAELGVS